MNIVLRGEEELFTMGLLRIPYECLWPFVPRESVPLPVVARECQGCCSALAASAMSKGKRKERRGGLTPMGNQVPAGASAMLGGLTPMGKRGTKRNGGWTPLEGERGDQRKGGDGKHQSEKVRSAVLMSQSVAEVFERGLNLAQKPTGSGMR